MVDHIVQFGHALVPAAAAAAAAAHGGHAALIPAIILVLVLFIAARARSRRRGQAPATPPGSEPRRPRSARQAMSATPGRWESDTEPRDGSSTEGS